MKTTKAYLAGLGMAGMVIGSILVLLAVGTGVVGFDEAPNLGRSKHPLDRVVADDHGARDRGRARHLQDGWPWPAAAVDGQRFGASVGVQQRRKPAARRREESRRRSRSVAARGFGGAQSWTRMRLGGGAALGAGAARVRRPGRSARRAGGLPEMAGGAIAPLPPPDPAR
jgi:hypothetical protein